MGKRLECRPYLLKPSDVVLSNQSAWDSFLGTDICTAGWLLACIKSNSAPLNWDREENTNFCNGGLKTYTKGQLDAPVEWEGEVTPNPDGTLPEWFETMEECIKKDTPLLVASVLGTMGDPGARGRFQLVDIFDYETEGEPGTACQLAFNMAPTGCLNINPLIGCFECGVAGFTPLGNIT